MLWCIQLYWLHFSYILQSLPQRFLGKLNNYALPSRFLVFAALLNAFFCLTINCHDDFSFYSIVTVLGSIWPWCIVSQLSLLGPGAGQGGEEFERRLQVLTRPCPAQAVSDLSRLRHRSRTLAPHWSGRITWPGGWAVIGWGRVTRPAHA